MYPPERGIYLAVLTECVVFAFMFVLFIVTIWRYHRKKLLLQNEKMVSGMLLIEEEKARVAADIHDDLGAMLSVLKYRLQMVEVDNEGQRLQLRKEIGYIDEIVFKVRTIANNMMPQILQIKGLEEALIDFVDKIKDSNKMRIRVEYRIAGCLADKEMEVHIYRIIQEIVGNVLKHSKASDILLQLESSQDKIRLRAIDNGVGFDTGGVTKSGRGRGIKNIVGRVDILKGKLYLSSGPEKGTEYIIEIPYFGSTLPERNSF